MRTLKVIIEKHPDGYVAYPVAVQGVVLGQGDSLGEAVADLRSALELHISCFGDEGFPRGPTPLEVFVGEVNISNGSNGSRPIS